MAKIHAIVNDTSGRVWCGPGAICSITGLPLSEVKQVIWDWREERGICKAIRGMHYTEVRAVLEILGFRCGPQYGWSLPKDLRPTLSRWLRERPKDTIKDAHLLNLTGHFVVVRGRKFVDNHTMEPVFLKKAPFRRKRVKSWTPIL